MLNPEIESKFPVLVGGVVTERHARICRERGHAQHVVDGVVMERCPRCGDVRESETPPCVRCGTAPWGHGYCGELCERCAADDESDAEATLDEGWNV
jgi:hypothetical protein